LLYFPLCKCEYVASARYRYYDSTAVRALNKTFLNFDSPFVLCQLLRRCIEQRCAETALRRVLTAKLIPHVLSKCSPGE
jgi:hypothetical protein